MNLFAERINPLSLEAGNPDLKPEKINTADFGIRWLSNAGSLTANLFYRHISDGITDVSRYIDNGIMLTTKENLQTSHNVGVELVWYMRVTDFQLNLGVKYDIPSINFAFFASLTDLLDTDKLLYILDTPVLKQEVEKRRNPRTVYVGLSWNFGGGGKKQHHNVEYDEEM